MSQENVELVERSLEKFNGGDLDAALQDADPEVEWHDQRELPGATVHHGREAAAEHLRSVLRALPGYRVDTEELVDAGDSVVVCGRVSAHGRASEVPVERPYFAVYTFGAGRVRRVRIFGSRAKALEAAGLEELAMSQADIEAFERAVDAYNRRDVEAMLAELDPEIEWHSALSMLLSGESTVHRRHEGIRELFREFDDVLDEIHVEYAEVRDLGERIVAIGRICTRGRESGAETESPIATVSDIRNGKSFRIRTYLDPKEALEAAGLSE